MTTLAKRKKDEEMPERKKSQDDQFQQNIKRKPDQMRGLHKRNQTCTELLETNAAMQARAKKYRIQRTELSLKNNEKMEAEALQKIIENYKQTLQKEKDVNEQIVSKEQTAKQEKEVKGI